MGEGRVGQLRKAEGGYAGNEKKWKTDIGKTVERSSCRCICISSLDMRIRLLCVGVRLVIVNRMHSCREAFDLDF